MTIPQASIVAIGTELTSGQTTNRNAAWLAAQLDELGVASPWHITVPDDRPRMRAALELAATHSDWIFVTGGLGPTSDDFTRDVVAEFLNAPLEFHPPSWERIEHRLRAAGIPVAPSNRQQCYYPRGAQVLENSAGTASGFSAEWRFAHRTGRIFVLPGPPREITAIWKQGGLLKQLRVLAPARAPTRLHTWQCLGLSESALGEVVEKAVEGTGLATGYRAHRPYIEVKIWTPEPITAAAQAGLHRVEQALNEWIATTGDTDLAQEFWTGAQRLQLSQWWIQDAATGGLLVERLGAALRSRQASGLQLAGILAGENTAPPNAAQIELTATPDFAQWRVTLRLPHSAVHHVDFAGSIRVPGPDHPDRANFMDRALRFGAEKALVAILKFTEGLNP